MSCGEGICRQGPSQSGPGHGSELLSASAAAKDSKQSTLCSFVLAGALLNILLNALFIHCVCSSGLASRNSLACACGDSPQSQRSARGARWSAGAHHCSPHAFYCLLAITSSITARKLAHEPNLHLLEGCLPGGASFSSHHSCAGAPKERKIPYWNYLAGRHAPQAITSSLRPFNCRSQGSPLLAQTSTAGNARSLRDFQRGHRLRPRGDGVWGLC